MGHPCPNDTSCAGTHGLQGLKSHERPGQLGKQQVLCQPVDAPTVRRVREGTACARSRQPPPWGHDCTGEGGNSWQGLGIQQAFKIGDKKTCQPSYCYTNDSNTAPWVAMSLGGITGISLGWALASAREIRPGTATMIPNSAFWGTWFGLSMGKPPVSRMMGSGPRC